MKQIAIAGRVYARRYCLGPVLIGLMVVPTLAAADEGGVSFWLTGQFGSLAAAPQQPGWSFANIYYHASVSAGGDVAAARQFTIRAFPRTATVSLNADLSARVDLGFVSAAYVFATPVLGGQFVISLAGAGGYNSTSIDALSDHPSGGIQGEVRTG